MRRYGCEREGEKKKDRYSEREKERGRVRSFPSIVRLHPHAATAAAAVEARNLATVARYNRYCGRGLNGGELELRSNRPTGSDNSSRSHGGERPLARYLQPLRASCSVSFSHVPFHPYSVRRAHTRSPSPRSAQPHLSSPCVCTLPTRPGGGGGGGGDGDGA